MIFQIKPLGCDTARLRASDHAHALVGATPILALDMYERSYDMDYGARASAYVDAFVENINWTSVARLHEACAMRT